MMIISPDAVSDRLVGMKLTNLAWQVLVDMDGFNHGAPSTQWLPALPPTWGDPARTMIVAVMGHHGHDMMSSDPYHGHPPI
jgi:hypothetical protein